MTITDRLALFAALDFAAIGMLFLTWIVIGWLIQHPGRRKPSVSILMADYRREWMRQMVTRQPRIFDSHTLSTLRQSTSFFASASLIAIGGALAAIGNANQLAAVAQDLTLSADPRMVLEVKLLITVLMLTTAFLKFVWSHRLFGYCAVLMGAVPNDPEDPVAMPRALKAAEINITAARSYNQGLRAIYFALASTAWLLGAVPLIAATAVTFSILWRREFASKSRSVLVGNEDQMGHTPS